MSFISRLLLSNIFYFGILVLISSFISCIDYSPTYADNYKILIFLDEASNCANTAAGYANNAKMFSEKAAEYAKMAYIATSLDEAKEYAKKAIDAAHDAASASVNAESFAISAEGYIDDAKREFK